MIKPHKIEPTTEYNYEEETNKTLTFFDNLFKKIKSILLI